MPQISPLASIDPAATIADDVVIGPFCAVGPDVKIGAGTRLISHVSLYGHTVVGKNNVFYPGASIGNVPQDLKHRGEATGLEIGDGNQIRENVTIHIGTVYGGKVHGGGITRIGNNNLLMVNVHIGHDVQMGSRCIIANNAMIGGHIVLGDHVVVNGAAGVNPFVTIGDFAYVDGQSAVHHDVPPFMKVTDQRIRAFNATGLKRAGWAPSDIECLENAARQLFFARGKPLSKAIAEFDLQNGIHPAVRRLIEFLKRRDSGKHGRYLEGLRPKL